MFDYGSQSPGLRPARTVGRIGGTSSAQGVSYPSPFFDLAHTYLPPTVRGMFRWCRYYYLTNPLINSVINKMAEYPITDLVLDTDNEGLKDKWEGFFEEDIQLRPSLIDVGLFYMCYGNAPISISFPFVKWLTCSHCKSKIEAKKAKYRFRSYKYYMTCEKCKNTGNAEAEDITIQSPHGTRLILWNPEDLDLQYNELTGKTAYYYTLPTHTRNAITMGKREIIEELPQLFIQSAKEGKSVVISPDNIFHLRRPSVLTGRHDRGWGIPLMLPVLKDTFYLQVMKKAQEAILVERIVPLTVIFPQAATGTSDPYTSINLTDWKNHINREIQKWRLDRNYIPILPLPIGNQVIGGDGRALLLSQEIRVWSEHIVAGMGVPQEFVFGGLQWSGSNVSLRMLENQFMRYLSSLLRLIKTFIIRKVSAHLEWPEIGIRFKPFKMADDLQRKAYLAQLNQGGKVSDTTILQDADLNPEEENDLMRKETKSRMEAVKDQQIAEATIQGEVGVISAKFQAKAMMAQQQEQMQAEQGAAGSAPGEPGEDVGSQPVPGGQPGGGGGAPPPGGGGDPIAAMVERLRAVSPHAQQQILQRIAQSNPQLAQQVASQLRGVGGAAGGGSASMPLPSQLPPRRGPGSAMI